MTNEKKGLKTVCSGFLAAALGLWACGGRAWSQTIGFRVKPAPIRVLTMPPAATQAASLVAPPVGELPLTLLAAPIAPLAAASPAAILAAPIAVLPAPAAALSRSGSAAASTPISARKNVALASDLAGLAARDRFDGRAPAAGMPTADPSGPMPRDWKNFVAAHIEEWKRNPDFSPNWLGPDGPRRLRVAVRSRDRDGKLWLSNGVRPGTYRVIDLSLAPAGQDMLLKFHIRNRVGVQTFAGMLKHMNGAVELRAGAWPITYRQAERLMRWQVSAGLHRVPQGR